jgi:uncharacterized protein (TIGR04255 family)
MASPKRITPDSIREAIVEVRYLSPLPHELLPGIFFEGFDNDYTYTDRPLKPPVMFPGSVNSPQQLSIQIGKPSLMFNKKISIQFLPQSFIFTCLNQYIGWQDYQPEIEKALRCVYSTGKIQAFTRVGLRYITEYTGKHLQDITKFEFKFGMPEIESVAIAFKSEFAYESSKVILNLHDKVPVFASVGSNELRTAELSRIDIDVIKENLIINDTEEVLKVIEQVHETEKNMFFGMLKDDFLKTLNPEY